MTSPLTPRQGGDGRYFHGEDYKGDGVLLNAVVFGGVGALAGHKFYERWRGHAKSDAELLGASIRHGALMAIRWKVWFVTCLWWLLTTPLWLVLASGILDTVLDQRPNAFQLQLGEMYSSPEELRYWVAQHTVDINVTGSWFHGSMPLVWAILAIHFVVGFLAIGVTYNRAIRESEFKQRWFYRRMAPLERFVPNVGWMILHGLVVVPIVLAIVSYNQ